MAYEEFTHATYSNKNLQQQCCRHGSQMTCPTAQATTKYNYTSIT